jgi:deoxyribose-phosphate aldolase
MELAGYIEYVNTAPNVSADVIRRMCAEAVQYHLYAVWVHQLWVPLALRQLQDTSVKVCSGPGVSFGAATETKVFGCRQVVSMGAHSVDVRLNLAALASGDQNWCYDDLSQSVQACLAENPDVEIKALCECACMTDEQKTTAAKLAERAGVHFVKTGTYAATVADVKLLRSVLSPAVRIKASGGIKTPERAREMLLAGASRLGASEAIELVKSTGGSQS